ncbi:hypothetical protein OHB24_23525 [Kribbella sp. NBC_00482]|uniref:hypothetical protein n=1 Tax=Kribbella sp. NBC_00482 TaxID=2975968 RepID=UPI002E1891D1
MKKKYRIWIIRSTAKRYRWIFTVHGDGTIRVLAQSARDYRSRRKVRKAIDKMKDAFPGAEVRDSDGTPGTFQLPATSFAVDFDVVPLMVDPPEERLGRARRANEQPLIATS